MRVQLLILRMYGWPRGYHNPMFGIMQMIGCNLNDDSVHLSLPLLLVGPTALLITPKSFRKLRTVRRVNGYG